MAPLPPWPSTNYALLSTRAAEQSSKGGMNKGTIVALSLLGFFIIVFSVTLIGYLFHRRAERNKVPPEKRPASYHPFRTSTHSSAKSSLLANAAPTGTNEDAANDKSSMFSRSRVSSLSVYMDPDVHADRSKRASVDTVSLIPLHVTPPAEEMHDDPMNGSTGSGVSNMSRLSLSTSTTGESLGLSQIPVPPEGYDASRPKGRPRSTSATSMRYYEAVNGGALKNSGSAGGQTGELQVPTIVTTPSP